MMLDSQAWIRRRLTIILGQGKIAVEPEDSAPPPNER